ncbi:MAG: FHA domain-containing protein [Pirellulales bacterium]|nr:FHA domain-containing protein [Planctomycetales bacterium]
MARVTLQIVDGADRGRVLENLSTPITIGREEGNSLQLNDERISRFHLKIQEDNDKVVLTDLESTNGTKVNGEETQLRILRYGDVITVGRSVLLYGSRRQIAQRLASLRKGLDDEHTVDGDEAAESDVAASLDFELNWSANPDEDSPLHILEAPDLPERLSPAQAAQLSELLSYFHIRIRHLIGTVRVPKGSSDAVLDARQWQGLLDLQARLARYLRLAAEPPHGDEPPTLRDTGGR